MYCYPPGGFTRVDGFLLLHPLDSALGVISREAECLVTPESFAEKQALGGVVLAGQGSCVF